MIELRYCNHSKRGGFIYSFGRYLLNIYILDTMISPMNIEVKNTWSHF